MKTYCLVYQISEGFNPEGTTVIYKFLTFDAPNDQEALKIAKQKNPGTYGRLFKLIKKI